MKGTEQRKTPEKIKRFLPHCAGGGPCIECHYDGRDFPQCISRLHNDALALIQQLEAETTWHPFPAEKPSDGALVWVYAPSALLYWARYNYAEYRHGTFWRGAERVDNVAAWMTVKEADHD